MVGLDDGYFKLALVYKFVNNYSDQFSIFVIGIFGFKDFMLSPFFIF